MINLGDFAVNQPMKVINSSMVFTDLVSPTLTKFNGLDFVPFPTGDPLTIIHNKTTWTWQSAATVTDYYSLLRSIHSQVVDLTPIRVTGVQQLQAGLLPLTILNGI